MVAFVPRDCFAVLKNECEQGRKMLCVHVKYDWFNYALS